MPENPEEEPKLIIDEDWKEQVQREKAAANAPDTVSAEAADDQEVPADAEAATEQAATEQAGTDAEDALPPLPPPNFEFLVSMLASQALDSMGQLPRPDGTMGKPQKPLAKHYIDLIGVLEEKTKGNLSSDESNMLSNILHQLRMAFVQVG